MQRYPITPEGQERLRAELRRMIEVDRPEVVLAIETARAHGDLSENAEEFEVLLGEDPNGDNGSDD